ncbi:hypothetical protein MLD63_09585 [Paracoccus sp. TK19116]|uniref:VPLPA-CTERM sorting domain-containing protein n=1 Tax=Paracoccus albicereus TaxID=2922394 RepID=A0ABT1MQU4_9RHOB|nr:hypothetical protein [Paracoccus albicereus]MCQ0970675.1 hypothetical protein [Paracoccus albicereus]
MRILKIAAVLAAFAALPASAATYKQNDKFIGQLDGLQTLTFSAPYATPCGNGDWSGCSYQADGQIMVVDDPKACGGWCGETLGKFYIDAYKPVQTLTIDFTNFAKKWVVIHFTGQNPVNFNAQSAATPSAVPLPAPAILLMGALAGLAGLRRRRRAA